MTVTSRLRGNPVHWEDGEWRNPDGSIADPDARCRVCGLEPVNVRVKVCAEVAFEGEDTWKVKPIDACIAPMVAAIQAAGVDMLGSCCGHGWEQAQVLLRVRDAVRRLPGSNVREISPSPLPRLTGEESGMRRNDITKMSPAELAIRGAMLAVEHMGADVLLTEAVNLLGQAKDKVADYVDSFDSQEKRAE